MRWALRRSRLNMWIAKGLDQRTFTRTYMCSDVRDDCFCATNRLRKSRAHATITANFRSWQRPHWSECLVAQSDNETCIHPRIIRPFVSRPIPIWQCSFAISGEGTNRVHSGRPECFYDQWKTQPTTKTGRLALLIPLKCIITCASTEL